MWHLGNMPAIPFAWPKDREVPNRRVSPRDAEGENLREFSALAAIPSASPREISDFAGPRDGEIAARPALRIWWGLASGRDRGSRARGRPSIDARSRRSSRNAWEGSPLHRTEDVLATLGMVRHHKLDVRTVTMGIDLHVCASPDVATLCGLIRKRIVRYAGRLREVCLEVEGRYGIPIVNRRIAVSPIASGRRRAHGRGVTWPSPGRSTRWRPRSRSISSGGSAPWCRKGGPRGTVG